MATIKRKTKYKSKSRSRSVNKKFSKQRKIVRLTQKGGLKIISGSSKSAMAKKGAKRAKATGQLSPATYGNIVKDYNTRKASGTLANKITPHELLPTDLKSRNLGNFGKKLTPQEIDISTIRTKYMQNQAKKLEISNMQNKANKLAAELARFAPGRPTRPAPPPPKADTAEVKSNSLAVKSESTQPASVSPAPKASLSFADEIAAAAAARKKRASAAAPPEAGSAGSEVKSNSLAVNTESTPQQASVSPASASPKASSLSFADAIAAAAAARTNRASAASAAAAQAPYASSSSKISPEALLKGKAGLENYLGRRGMNVKNNSTNSSIGRLILGRRGSFNTNNEKYAAQSNAEWTADSET
jgi:hypothetical protein